MKNLLFVVICIFCGINVFCQENGKYDFNIQYDMQLNLNGNINYKANLYFNNTQSLFEYQETPFDDKEQTEKWINKKIEESNNASFNLRIKDTVRLSIKYNRNENLIKEFIKGSDSKFYQVTDSSSKLIWVISDEHKKIDPYECTKATCSFRGRNYIVWFTTAIQTNFGPLKLHGLPGLIVEMIDEKKEIMLSAIIVKKEEKIIENDPIGTIIISRSEYQKIKADDVRKVEEILNRVTSKSERGLKITAKITSYNSIEMD